MADFLDCLFSDKGFSTFDCEKYNTAHIIRTTPFHS